MSHSDGPAWVKKLRHLAERHSQCQLAEALGSSRQTIYRWLKGDTKPQPRLQRKIEEVYREQFATEGVLSETHDSSPAREVTDPAFSELVEVTAAGDIPIPSRAVELVSWLRSSNMELIECLGRFGTRSGRIVEPKVWTRAHIDTFKTNFAALVQNPKALADDILRLAVYLSNAWEVEFLWDTNGNCHASVTWPPRALLQGQRVCVFAALPDTLTIYLLDDLQTELRETSRDFRNLLSRLSELAEES